MGVLSKPIGPLGVGPIGVGIAGVVIFLLKWLRDRRSATGCHRNPKQKTKEQQSGLFWRRFACLWRICIPGVRSVEALLLLGLMILLLLRTSLTVVMAGVVGKNAKWLVNRDFKRFIAGVVNLGLLALPSTIVNTGIRYCTSLMEQLFRRNLQEQLHAQYLHGTNVYRIANNTNSIDNADHRLTQDVMLFCSELTDIFPSVLKPSFDIITFIVKLAQNGGFGPPALMILYYLLMGGLLRRLMPDFGTMHSRTQQKEGDLRTVHAQINQHAEEVAFYRGESIEKSNANHHLRSLIRHLLHVAYSKGKTDFWDGLLIKYWATCAGYAVCAIGVFAQAGKVSTGELTRLYIESSQLYIPLALAIGKLVMLHKTLTTLGGCTHRVGKMKEMLDMMDHSSVNCTITEIPGADAIELDQVTIATPESGLELIREFSFTFRKGTNVLIMGNNGSGKSSLLRVIAGLWPALSGSITRPLLDELMFLPQRVYLPYGTFLEQLIFPDRTEDMRSRGITEEDIMKMSADAGLDSVIEREGGLHTVKQWSDVLSGGERQRLAVVRILYKKPMMALLDECTSAVSQDVEPDLYRQILSRGVTLVTISHRESLVQLHDVLITLDGSGSYKISRSSPQAPFDSSCVP